MAGPSGMADGETKTPQQAIETAFLSLNRVIESETDCTVASMDVLERINWNATNKYSRLADACQGLNTDRDYLSQLNSDVEKYSRQVQGISRHIDHLEALTRELDEWSKELEVKSRRFKRK